MRYSIITEPSIIIISHVTVTDLTWPPNNNIDNNNTSAVTGRLFVVDSPNPPAGGAAHHNNTTTVLNANGHQPPVVLIWKSSSSPRSRSSCSLSAQQSFNRFSRSASAQTRRSRVQQLSAPIQRSHRRLRPPPLKVHTHTETLAHTPSHTHTLRRCWSCALSRQTNNNIPQAHK